MDWTIREEYGVLGLVTHKEVAEELSRMWGGTEVNYVGGESYHVAFSEAVQEALSKEIEEELISFVNSARRSLGKEEISSLPVVEEDSFSSIATRLWKAFDQIDDGWYVDLREDCVIFSRSRAAEAVASAWGTSVREEKEYDAYDEEQVLYRYVVDFPERLAELMEIIHSD